MIFLFLCFVVGAFLIPYVIFLFLCGIPLVFLEMSMGQYAGEGPLSIWSICPLAKGMFSDVPSYKPCRSRKFPSHYFPISTNHLPVNLSDSSTTNQILTECGISIIWNFRYMRRLFQYCHTLLADCALGLLCFVIKKVYQW